MDTNASMALRIAVGVLIAVMIISLLVYFFKRLTPWQQGIDDRKTDEQVTAFNKEFLAYDKKIMYGTDLISVINKAANSNLVYINEMGYQTALNNGYLINIVFRFKTKPAQRIEVYRIDEASKSEILVSDISALNQNIKDDIVGKINSKIATPISSSIFNSSTSTSSIIDENTNLNLYDNNKPHKFLSDAAWEIVSNSNDPKITVKNTNSDPTKGPTATNWSKAILTTSVYDIKSRKFRSAINIDKKPPESTENRQAVTFDDNTGRIIGMSFEEIGGTGGF